MPKQSNTLGVSIVTYNTAKPQLVGIVNKLLADEAVSGICIIDNSPEPYFDQSDFGNPLHSEKLHIIFNTRNTGYVAHNLGVKHSMESGYEYHLILNSDVEFESDTLKNIKEKMRVNEHVGLLMPMVIYPDGRLQRLAKFLPNPATMLLRMLGIKGVQSLDISSPSTSTQSIFVPYLSGCFMFMRTSVLNDVGLMDERFFMYGEDIDLSRRIATVSAAVYHPQVQIVHHHGAGSKRNIGLFWIHLKNVAAYFSKWGWFFDKERKALNAKCGEVVDLKG
jgi:GT2 family glycosyltransferase